MPAAVPAVTPARPAVESPVAFGPGVAMPVVAALAAASPVPARPARALAVPGSAGMRVARDPETGRLVAPTAEQLAALGTPAEPLDGNYADIPVTLLPDGSKKVTLDERFMDYTVVRRTASGALRFECVRGSDGLHDHESCAQADRSNDGSAPPAPVWEVR